MCFLLFHTAFHPSGTLGGGGPCGHVSQRPNSGDGCQNGILTEGGAKSDIARYLRQVLGGELMLPKGVRLRIEVEILTGSRLSWLEHLSTLPRWQMR